MVYRIFTEKKKEFAVEAQSLLSDIKNFLKIDKIEDLRIFNCYDVENISDELFSECKNTVFSEPQTDEVYSELPDTGDACIVYEYLPGQFDQRADSAAQCIQLISCGVRPIVRTKRALVIYGQLSETEIAEIEKYVINPVESMKSNLELPKTLDVKVGIPASVEIIHGFNCFTDDELKQFISDRGLAMDFNDIKCCQKYFLSKVRNPTITEIKVLDTYWSDHCRHTTFLTELSKVDIKEEYIRESYEKYLEMRRNLKIRKPVTLMDMATIGAKYLRDAGLLDRMDVSDEINACTVKIDVDTANGTEKWLLLFKNETHNHPTEIEPFGGAATCIGGAIRDPLSGRSYVYQAMRVTGAANPLKPVSETMKGKLPQRKIVTSAAAGYSSYGNQIGLATGLVDEIYHDGYAAKHMEVGMVVGAAPAKNVIRKTPEAGDKVILLGGKTGRDGCGGATGSSKSHDVTSLETCGAEVQKGNAPEERKLQRLFRNPRASVLIKRCNDFGAGGVSVAVGELAEGLEINLNAIAKKYEGLDGTELAISESQERMAVVIAEKDLKEFLALAHSENLEANVVAEVTSTDCMIMRWNSKVICELDRSFLNSNGAPKHAEAEIGEMDKVYKIPETDPEKLAQDLNICSRQGLSERFDSTIGAGTVLMPYGGKYQKTPIQAMVGKIPVLSGETKSCSVCAYGYNPFVSEMNPYNGAYYAVIESVAKVIAAGGNMNECYLTFQEYFKRLGDDPKAWGLPLAAMLGALKAQTDLKIASIGGKDSMSGTFEDISVPPTLISFAVSKSNTDNIISPEFKEIGKKVWLINPETDENGILIKDSLIKVFETVSKLISKKYTKSVYALSNGGITEAVMKMAFGNRIGFTGNDNLTKELLESYMPGGFVVVSDEDVEGGIKIGVTTEDYSLVINKKIYDISDLENKYDSVLESVYPMNAKTDALKTKKVKNLDIPTTRGIKKVNIARPRVVIPVFPGTNCEYDTARAFAKAGAKTEVFVVNNLTSEDIKESAEKFSELIHDSQIIFIPGGFSGGDEPDGSGKFITAFFRNPKIAESVSSLLNRDGLIGGICNGFQALIKLGLVTYGKITDMTPESPTLTFNTIGRHQSRMVRTRIVSNKSPWLMYCNTGDVHLTPVSHGEGRFICNEELFEFMHANGQIATQYADINGNASMDIKDNPNGSDFAVEGLLSPDGRVFGKMAHSERIGDNLYKNVNGNTDNKMFKGAVDYFKL